MEKLCQEITASHEQRQALLKELKSGALQLREETAQMLEGFRGRFEKFRDDLQAARKAWQKAITALAKKRQHTK